MVPEPLAFGATGAWPAYFSEAGVPWKRTANSRNHAERAPWCPPGTDTNTDRGMNLQAPVHEASTAERY